MNVRPSTATGSLQVPGSKSWTHRAYVLAAAATDPVTIHRPLRSADPEATLACLQQLGAQVEIDGESTRIAGGARQSKTPLDCRNAGTGLRLLTAAVARHPFSTTLTGDASLVTRPNGPLLDALRGLGVRIDGDGDGRCPYTVTGPMQAGTVRLAGGTSSQFASALMLALPMLEGDSRLQLRPPVRSRPYLDVTQRCLEAFGIHIGDGDDIIVPGGQRPTADHITIPGDWSSAAFPMAAAAITDGDIRIAGLDLDDPQGDRRIVQLLRRFGARIDVGDTVRVRGGRLAGQDIDVEDTPDLFPILAVVAACAKGTTTFRGGATLRHKESDRIAAMASGLRQMGIRCDEREDGLLVHGGRLRGARLDIPDDHRIHMAFYVAALAADGSSHIPHEDSAMISFPGFHASMSAVAS